MAKRKTVGRPVKPVTEEAKAAIIQAIAGGANRIDAARAAGISKETLRKWRMGDEAFDSEVERADSEAVKQAEQKIFFARDWKASLAWLQAKRPERWGKREKVENTGKIEVVVTYAESGASTTETTLEPTEDS